MFVFSVIFLSYSVCANSLMVLFFPFQAVKELVQVEISNCNAALTCRILFSGLGFFCLKLSCFHF